MTDFPPPSGPPRDVDLWFAAGFRTASAAQRRRGWLYGRTALDAAAAGLVGLYKVGRRYGWTLEQLGRVDHADSCLDAVALRMRDMLPTDVLYPGWRDGLLDALDMRLQRLAVPTQRRPGALVVPPAGRHGQRLIEGSSAPLEVAFGAVHSWEFHAGGHRLAFVVADVDQVGVDEVAGLALDVWRGRRRLDPRPPQQRTPYETRGARG
ncbi:hypothetical protein [Micromonospora thermarum]|uniref:Uncharacterized protein n=1 Tax=Micromonospora thermarum TaxID=2720024 RepID=A0ABX0ZBQ8_9ACTN|nr:hypothetical protein [Micromonospora thermarum]NJP33721.1 hypothetical protein [Micromonospora thermarum]